MPLINYITQIQFDFGAIEKLPDECARIGIKRPLIVTDAGVKAAGIIDKVLVALRADNEPAIFLDTLPNPNERAAHSLVDAWGGARAVRQDDRRRARRS